MRRRILLALFLSAVLGWSTDAAAQQPFSACTTERFQFAGTADDNPNLFLGPVEIVCDDTVLYADELERDPDGSLIHARGRVTLIQDDVRISADRAEVDRVTRLGTFFDATGFARLGDEPVERSPFGTAESDFLFWGEEVSRTGDRQYEIVGGGFTTCVQPTPRWHITGSRGRITLDERVVMRNVTLRVKGVPLLYVPIIYYPIEDDERSTGFLLPTYSTSTIRGTGISNAFFLELGRSQDATFFHDWYSRSGQGFGAEYRYVAAPGSDGFVQFHVLDERAQAGAGGSGFSRPASRYYDLDGHVTQALPGRARLMARANYFSNTTTRRIYEQNLLDFSQRRRDLHATVSGSRNRLRYDVTAEQRDDFSGDQARRYRQLPVVNLSLAHKAIGGSPVYFGVSGEGGVFLRQDDLADPDTERSFWRVDTSPSVRAALSTLPFLDVRAGASWRFTQWSQSQDPDTGIVRETGITRHLFAVSLGVVGPKIERVFQTPDNGYAERFKHRIDPFLTFEYLSPFERSAEVVRINGVDNLVGGSTQITYGVSSDLLARRRVAEGTGPVRTILSGRIQQTYYSNTRAARFDGRYESATDGSFSPIDISVEARVTDRTSARFRMDIDAERKAIRTLSASGSVQGTHVQASASWSKRRHIPGLPGFEETRATHYLNPTVGLRTRDNRLGGTYSLNWDVLHGTLLQQRIVAYYSAQCCGVSVDYQALTGVSFGSQQIPTDRRVGISFTLAGIGSFSNPLGSFGQ